MQSVKGVQSSDLSQRTGTSKSGVNTTLGQSVTNRLLSCLVHLGQHFVSK